MSGRCAADARLSGKLASIDAELNPTGNRRGAAGTQVPPGAYALSLALPLPTAHYRLNGQPGQEQLRRGHMGQRTRSWRRSPSRLPPPAGQHRGDRSPPARGSIRTCAAPSPDPVRAGGDEPVGMGERGATGARGEEPHPTPGHRQGLGISEGRPVGAVVRGCRGPVEPSPAQPQPDGRGPCHVRDHARLLAGLGPHQQGDRRGSSV